MSQRASLPGPTGPGMPKVVDAPALVVASVARGYPQSTRRGGCPVAWRVRATTAGDSAIGHTRSTADMDFERLGPANFASDTKVKIS